MPATNRKGKPHGAFWLVAACSLPSCASVQQTDFEAPNVPEKLNWSQDLGEDWSIEIDWWRRFGDPELEQLVKTAVANNVSLRVLAARSGEARAEIGEAQADLLPTLTTGTSAAGGLSQAGPTQYNVGAELSWEIDIWGKARKNAAAQKAAYQASLADWRAGHLALVSDVATAYLQLRLLDEQLARQQQSIDRGTQILNIYADMKAQGLIPEADVLGQRSELSAQRAALIDLKRSRDLTVNGLATLLGEPAGNLKVPNTAALAAIKPVDVPAGLPSEILSRRPDIVAAEYRLLRAVDLKAGARLARLPSIGLTGAGGAAAFSLSTLFRTVAGQVTSFVRFPIFDPQVRARIRVSEAQIQTAEEEYRATVMQAFEEVENALTNVSRRKEELVELEDRLAALTAAQQTLKEQLEIGEKSSLDVLEAQRSLLDAQQQVLITRWQILMDTVSLFKAVGGGWPPEQVGIQVPDSHAADSQARF